MKKDLIRVTERGLYCEAGDFYIDPWRPVSRAVITHAHADHARSGCDAYLCAEVGRKLLRVRIGPAEIEGLEWGERRDINGVTVSLHPAGHILGSAQVRVEHRGEVWVVSGDYKTVPDPACEAFDPVKCDVFITESTFGLPVYRWPPAEEVFGDINAWWAANREAGRSSMIFAYPLGKSQRLLAGLDPEIGPIGVYGNAHRFVSLYEEQGRKLAPCRSVNADNIAELKGTGLVIAPAMLQNTRPLQRLGDLSLAFASGWMRLRGARRRSSVDRGFVLSDHADWNGLLDAIATTGAQRIGVTHGYTEVMTRYLREEKGLDAFEVPTRFIGENLEQEKSEPQEEAPTAE